MELIYPIKVLYTLGPSQLMLARANPAECRAVKPRPNAKDGVKHASTELKGCLSAICAASPELLADPNADHSVYAIDPLQTPELSVGYGLLKWASSESRRVVGVVTEDYVDGEEMEVLEVKISLTPTVAVSREQHAHSLQGLSNPKSSSANPSPPTTPLSQPQSNQPTRASTRVRVRTRKDKSTTPPPPAAKRGRPRRANSPVAPAPSGARSNSPGPSRTHSRVSSVSSLALSQTQAQPVSKPPSRAPASSASQTRTSHPSSSQQDSQSESSRTLARLLSSSSSTSSASGTPMLDSLLQRIKSGGLASALQATGLSVQANESGSGPRVKLEGVSDAQQQALLALLKFASSNSGNGTAGETGGASRSNSVYSAQSPAGGAAPSPAALAAPSPRPFAAPSPAYVPAPSPAASIVHRPSSSASVSGYPHTDASRPTSSLGVRKREMDDGEIVEIDPTESLDCQIEPKRAKMNAGAVRAAVGGTSDGQVVGIGNTPLGDVRSWSTGDLGFGNAAPSPSMSVASPQPSMTSSALSPNGSVTSPNISAAVASPSVSVASPAISAASPYMAVPSPAPSTISPAISAASPYPYPYPVSAPPMSNSQPPLGPPRVLTATVSQPNISFSQPAPPQSAASTSSRRRTTRGSAQTDLPAWSGSFITPRDQIGQPRAPAPVEAPPPPPARKSAPGPSRPKVTAPKNKEDAARKVRGVSEEEVRDMLAGGYYPSGGLQDEHRRLFGAGSKSGKSVSTGNGGNTGAKEPSCVDEGKAEVKADPVVVPNAPSHSSSAPVSTSSRPPSSTGMSSHYRSTSTASTAPAPPPRPRQPRAPVKTPRQRPPTIPKRSPVAMPAVSRLPMMMTSPIRATGAPGSTSAAQSLSLNEYSPLRRLLKTAGVDKIEDVLGQGGVLGLKGASGWRSTTAGSTRAGGKAAMKREQEREVVDLTSDADDEEDPPPGPAAKQRPQTPPRSGAPQSQESRPSTPPRRQTPYVAVTPPRKAHTSPPRQPESPLFNPAEPPYATSSDAPENLPMLDEVALPMDLPPSSPPPMSDSESASGLENGGNEYRENAQEEYSSDAPIPDLGLQDIGTDEEDGGWDETIRPAEPAAPEDTEPIGQFLSAEQLEFLSSEADLGLGLPASGNSQLDLEALSSLLNMLEAPTSEVGVEAEINMNTVLEGAQASALDFSWLDALGNGEGQAIDLNVVGLHEQDIPPSSDTDGEGMSEAELAQILAAFGTS